MSMHDNSTDSLGPHTSHHTPIYAILISTIMFVLFATLLALALCCIRRLPRQNSTSSAAAAVDFNGGTFSSCHQNGKLKPEVLASLTVFTYPLMPHGEKLECAVCLAEFTEGEKGRILPRCHHSFHTECIDMWLDSQFTCPLCRVSIQTESPDSVV